MTDSRKKPGFIFWLIVAVVTTLLLYPLSSGPAIWISSSGYFPNKAIEVIYTPLLWAMEHSPESVQGAGLEWFSLWTPDWEKQRRQEQLGETIMREAFRSLAEGLQDGSEADAEEAPISTGEGSPLVISLPTTAGTLVVTVSDPDADVKVFKEECKIEIVRNGAKEPSTISVDPGADGIKMQRGGSSILAERFEIEPGTKRAITAKIVPHGDGLDL